jgi:hypothetical protein
LAEVVEEGADFFGGAVDVVGVLVEEGEKEFFPSLAVAALAGSAGSAGEVLFTSSGVVLIAPDQGRVVTVVSTGIVWAAKGLGGYGDGGCGRP